MLTPTVGAKADVRVTLQLIYRADAAPTCFATSVPATPIATPIDACCSAGASFTPSPVIAATWARARRSRRESRRDLGAISARISARPRPCAAARVGGAACPSARRGKRPCYRIVGAPPVRPSDRMVRRSNYRSAGSFVALVNAPAAPLIDRRSPSIHSFNEQLISDSV